MRRIFPIRIKPRGGLFAAGKTGKQPGAKRWEEAGKRRGDPEYGKREGMK